MDLRSWMLLLLSLNCSGLIVALAELTNEACNQMTSTTSICKCVKYPDRYQIACTDPDDNNKQVLVDIHPEENVQTSCRNIKTPQEFDDLFKINITVGNVKHFDIRNYPFTEQFNVNSVIKMLSVTFNNKLIIRINETEIHPISNNLLKDLNPIQSLQIDFGNQKIPENLLQDTSAVRQLKELRLVFKTGQLPERFLDNLPKLKILEIVSDHIITLPAGIFQKLENLKYLQLMKLEKLPKDLFHNLTALSILELMQNPLIAIDEDTFYDLKNLEIINLSHTRLESLPSNLFKNNQKLQKFTFKYNKNEIFKEIPANLFANLEQLKTVSLNGNNFQSLPADVFEQCSALSTIDLGSNNLSSIPGDLLENQVHLVDLDMSNNKLQSLPDELFEKTVNLQTLKLSHNNLTNISGQVFRSLNKLEVLDISHNRLVNVDGAFESTTRLIHLSLNNNQLKFDGWQNLTLNNEEFKIKKQHNSPFQQLERLETLNLAQNHITYISKDWRLNLLNLRLLDLTSNQISTLEDADLFSYMQQNHLKILLNNNTINNIILSQMTMPNMVEQQSVIMDFGINTLNCDCLLLPFLLYLQEHNKPPANTMSYVPKVDFNIENLSCKEPALLAHNTIINLNPADLACPFDLPGKIPLCPENCKCMVKPYNMILEINCKNAKFTQLPELLMFENKAEFKEIILNMENNNIARLQSLPVGYEFITQLNLAGNDLEEFQIQQLPPNLNHLDLSRNKFTNINNDLLQEFNKSKTLQSLELGDNPWQCDCKETRSLLEFIQNKRNIIKKSRTTMKCANYDDNKSLYTMTIFELCAKQNENFTTWTLVISTAALLTGLLLALYYKYQRQITLFLYVNNFCIWFFPKGQLDRKGEYEFDIFMSYSHKDSELVRQALVPMLRQEPYGYRLCIDEDNWLPGSVISEEIARSVEDSYCTMIVLSKNYIESKWAKWEFKTALQSSLVDRKHRLIMIKYGDIGKIEDLDKDLKAYLKYNLYLEWGDKKFWEKLRFTLSHTESKKSKISSSNRSEHQHHHVNEGGTVKIVNSGKEAIANGKHFEDINELKSYGISLNKDQFNSNGYQKCLSIDMEPVAV